MSKRRLANCDWLSAKEKKIAEDLMNLGERMDKSPEYQKLGTEWAAAAFKKIHRHVMGDKQGLPNVEEMKLLTRLVNRNIKMVSKRRGFIAKWLYLPEEIYKDVDFVDSWYDTSVRAHQTFKGNLEMLRAEMNVLTRALRNAAVDKGIQNSFKIPFTTGQIKVVNELNKRYKKYWKIRRQGKEMEAAEYFTEKIKKYLEPGAEGEILHEFHMLATDKKYYDQNKDNTRIHVGVRQAARVWRDNINPAALNMMVKGLEQYYMNITKRDTKRLLSRFGDKYENVVNATNNLIKKFSKMKEEGDAFLPVMTFDIMPSLAEANRLIQSGSTKAQFDKGANIVEGLESVLDRNIYINKNMHTDSSAVGDYRNLYKAMDYNILPVIDSYINSAARFNYVTFNAGKYADVMKNISKSLLRQPETGNTEKVDKKLKFLKSYIEDNFRIVTGKNQRDNPTQSNIARAITAFEFSSKLGLNFRSHARNATQSLLNYVYFGFKGLGYAREIMRDPKMSVRVTDGLKNNGILYAPIEEIYYDTIGQRTEVDANGRIVERFDLKTSEIFAEKMSRLASYIGQPMQAIENNINRGVTFKLAYAKAWEIDNKFEDPIKRIFDKQLEKDLVEENKRRVKKDLEEITIESLKKEEATLFEKGDTTEYLRRFELYRRGRAERFANQIVKDLHFDYAMTAKSKILTGPKGSVLGQFQHFGISFFNLQRKLIRDGVDDIVTGQYAGVHAWRMYRLGILNLAINGILSPFFNADFGNIVQNDTLERAQNYWDLAMGDEKERKEAFYGKGPVLGTFGGPFIADMVTLGNIWEIWDMLDTKPEGILSLLSGYEEMANQSTNEKFKESVKVLSTQGYRTIYQTFPKIQSGANFWTLVLGEMGTFPNEKTKWWRGFWDEKLALSSYFLPKVNETLGIKMPEKKKIKTPEAQQLRVTNQAVLESIDRI